MPKISTENRINPSQTGLSPRQVNVLKALRVLSIISIFGGGMITMAAITLFIEKNPSKHISHLPSPSLSASSSTVSPRIDDGSFRGIITILAEKYIANDPSPSPSSSASSSTVSPRIDDGSFRGIITILAEKYIANDPSPSPLKNQKMDAIKFKTIFPQTFAASGKDFRISDIMFKGGSEVVFSTKGQIRCGILAQDSMMNGQVRRMGETVDPRNPDRHFASFEECAKSK